MVRDCQNEDDLRNVVKMVLDLQRVKNYVYQEGMSLNDVRDILVTHYRFKNFC